MRWASIFVMAICACGGAPAGWLSETRVLVRGVGVAAQDCRAQICQHNENTDLVRWNNAVWLVHRTAESQVLGPNSALHVYRSGDGGKSFAQTAIIPAPADRDLRDPHFFVVGNQLCLKAITRLPVTSARDSNTQSISVQTCTLDGAAWSDRAPIAPAGNSFWRVARAPDGTYYSAAYSDGDQSVTLYSSQDGMSWSQGALIYGVAADTPLETELVFLPREAGTPRMLALVRMDGTDMELFGTSGRLRTKVCFAEAPYAQFQCNSELTGQRLDGPAALLWHQRLFVVARKHLGADGKKRTSLFELPLGADGMPSGIVERGELPSAGDTAYAGLALLDDHRVLATWYSSDLKLDPDWVTGILGATDIWQGTIDLNQVPAR